MKSFYDRKIEGGEINTIKSVAKRIIRIITIFFSIFTLMMIYDELTKPTLYGFSKIGFFWYAVVALFLAFYVYMNSK